MNTIKARITNLEIKISYQTDTIDELNDEIIIINKKLSELNKFTEFLLQQLNESNSSKKSHQSN